MKQLSLNKLLIALLSFVFVICTALGVIGFANQNTQSVRAEGETTTHTLFKARAEITGASAGWIWFSNNAAATATTVSLENYTHVRLIFAATKADMLDQYLITLEDASDNKIYLNNYALTLQTGKNVIEVAVSDLTVEGNAIAVSDFVVTSVGFLVQTNNGTKEDVTYLTGGIQLVGASDTNTDFDSIEYDVTEEPENPEPTEVATYTYFKGVADITGGQSSWVWFHEKGTVTPNQKALGEYEKIRIIIAASKVNMVREINVSFTAPIEGETGYVTYSSWNLTLNDGEKNVIELTPSQMKLTVVTDVNTFVPTGFSFLIKTDKEGYTDADTTKLTAGVQLVGTDDTNTDFDSIEYDVTEEPENPEPTEVATHTLFKARAKITGASAGWIWHSSDPAATVTPTTLSLENYTHVRLIFAATKLEMLDQYLITLKDDSGHNIYIRKYVSLQSGKKVVEIPISDLEVENNAIAVSDFVVTSVGFLVQTNNGTKEDVTYLTGGIQLVGASDTNNDFEEIEYDPEMVTSHTFFKNTSEITGGVGANDSWILFHEGASAIANDKNLGAYSKVRIILAATKAEMVSEINVTISDKDGNSVSYNNNALEMEEGKTVIELTLEQLTLSSGVTDVNAFVPESVSFLVRTNKEGFTAEDKTKLTAGVQFVGDKENSDFEEIEYDPYDEPDISLITDHVYMKESAKTVKGGSTSWIGVENTENIVRSDYYMDKYAGVKIIIEGEKASMISQYNIVIGDDTNYIAYNHWYNFSAQNGKNEYLIPIKDMKVQGDISLATYRPDKLELGVKTDKGTESDECEIKFTVVFVTAKDAISTDIKLFDFNYKGGSADSGVIYDSENGTYTEDKGTIVGEFGPSNGQDGASGGCKITVKTDTANGQMWLTTGGRWKDQNPAGVTSLDTLYFQDFGSVDLYFYVSDANYIENIMLTMSSADGCWLDGPGLQKVIGMIEKSGWQHLRFNLDSMTALGGFDWNEKTEFVSIELVVTVRAGTPVDEVLIFDDFYLRQDTCHPTIEANKKFVLVGETGTEIDLSDSVITGHPFGDKINTSFGVKFAKTEDGTKQVVTASGGVFTPYKAGYYFVTAIVTDSMGASAQLEYTIAVTGDDIDAEEPSISFGSMPTYLAKPGELDLSGITVTDDMDTNPTVTIKVTDESGKELTVANGKVNITVAGRYTVTVTATDAANHTKTLTRNVTVEGGTTENPGTEDSEGGCGGAIGATSFAALGFIALAVVKMRKKER